MFHSVHAVQSFSIIGGMFHQFEFHCNLLRQSIIHVIKNHNESWRYSDNYINMEACLSSGTFMKCTHLDDGDFVTFDCFY